MFVCGMLILKNGHEVLHVLGTCQDFFDVINMPTQNFSYMFTSRENFLGKRGARDTYYHYEDTHYHYEDTVDVETSFQQ